MPRASRAAAVLAGAAFATGWMFRQVFPKITCPNCSSGSWTRLGGGLKQCRACSHKFFMQLPEPKRPGD